VSGLWPMAKARLAERGGEWTSEGRARTTSDGAKWAGPGSARSGTGYMPMYILQYARSEVSDKTHTFLPSIFQALCLP
jgi:hypothetical protein